MTKPEKIEKTHGVPVATIHFRSYELPLLELFVYFVQHAASALGIPASGVAMLPRRRQLWTVPRSPFVHKKSQQSFERVTHKRAIKLWDANPQILGFLETYMAKHEMGGVGVRVVRWDRAPLSVGQAVYLNALKHPNSHREMLDNASKRVIKAEKKAANRLRRAQDVLLAQQKEEYQSQQLMARKAEEVAATAAGTYAATRAARGAAGGSAEDEAKLADGAIAEGGVDDAEYDEEDGDLEEYDEEGGELEDDGDEVDSDADSDAEDSDWESDSDDEADSLDEFEEGESSTPDDGFFEERPVESPTAAIPRR